MTFLLLRRDTDTSPWTYMGASDERPDPAVSGSYLLLDTEQCGELLEVAPTDEAEAKMRDAADRFRAAQELPPLTDQQAAAFRSSVVKTLSQP